MELISLPFAVLAIASVIVFYSLNYKYRIGYLTFLSCGFIAGLNLNLLFYVIVYSCVNYYIGKRMPGSRLKKTLFRTGVIFNLLQLVLLKYASFTIDPIFQVFNTNFYVSKISEIVIPFGISFFTLQGIGYLINVKMGWEMPEKNFLKFFLYIVFYPKFLSGPIERSNHFLPQLGKSEAFNSQQVSEGLRIALLGFFKKVVIANNLGTIVNNAYSDLSIIGGADLWTIVLIQPLYLYFDFSGYTDIAIGLAKTYGIDLLPNFNKPFLSENVTTFWKRFHMSLSFWFNDYVFKQLSFKLRKWGQYASVFSVFVTFTLFGIWHGAGWNFMILGFLQAMAINYEFFTRRARTRIFAKLPYFTRIWIGRITTYVFFGLALVFFFSPDMNTTLAFFRAFVSTHPTSYSTTYGMVLLFTLALAVAYLIIEIIENDFKKLHYKVKTYWINHRSLRLIFYWIAILLIITQITGHKTFIYQMF